LGDLGTSFSRGKKEDKNAVHFKMTLENPQIVLSFRCSLEGRNKSWDGQGRQRRQTPSTPQTGALNLGSATKLGKIWRQELYDSMGYPHKRNAIIEERFFFLAQLMNY
ncbi:hypothetical protein ANOM_005832, partial [Aspergillus nomiae NRRL 13137]